MTEETTEQAPTSNGMNTMVIGGIIAVVVVAGIAFVMSKGNAEKTQPESKEVMQLKEESTPSSDEAVKATESAMTENTFIVKGANFSFTPNEIRVKKGEKVTITFSNSEGFHDFRIDEFNIKTKQIAAGASETVEFTPDKAGSFEFYCSVGQHRQNGMKGTLIVE